jgi:hypothetical protein
VKTRSKPVITTRSNVEPTLGEALDEVRQSIMKLGTSLLSFPLVLLPEEARKHFANAGSEITYGLSAILRDIADRLEPADTETEPGQSET